MICLHEHWYWAKFYGLFVVRPYTDGVTSVLGPDVEVKERLLRAYERCEQSGIAFSQVHTEGIARALELEFIVESRRGAFQSA